MPGTFGCAMTHDSFWGGGYFGRPGSPHNFRGKSKPLTMSTHPENLPRRNLHGNTPWDRVAPTINQDLAPTPSATKRQQKNRGGKTYWAPWTSNSASQDGSGTGAAPPLSPSRIQPCGQDSSGRKSPSHWFFPKENPTLGKKNCISF